MLQLTPHHRLSLAVEPVDFTPRRGGNYSTFTAIAIKMPNILPQSSLSFIKGHSSGVSYRGLMSREICVIRLLLAMAMNFQLLPQRRGFS